MYFSLQRLLPWATRCSSPQLHGRETLHPGRQGGGRKGEGDRGNSRVEGGKGMRERGRKKGEKEKGRKMCGGCFLHVHTLTNNKVVL